MAVLGSERKAYIRTSSTLTWLAGEQSNSLNRTAEAIETSDKASDWASYVPGKKGGTVSITVYVDKSDAAQQAALSAFAEGDLVQWAVGNVQNGVLASGSSGSGVITGISDTNDNGAVSSRTIDIQISGAINEA